MSVLTLAQAKTHLNLSTTTNDVELQAFIDAAEAMIARIVGPLTATAVTARVRGLRPMLEVSTLPAISLTSVTPVNGAAMDLTMLYLDPTAGTIEFVSGAGRFGAAFYTVVYNAGYTSLPANLLLAVKELVRHLWSTQRGPSRRPGAAPSDTVANTLPGAAYALPVRVEQLLSPYVPLGSA